ncbi:hypothetical protein HHL26_00710 [Sphingobium sp. TB-6]|uniref:FecR family protein n=1 Tax=Sphingobium sp. TB-6 TaxID=2728850 RepID=UPI001469E9E0|nr:FecR domain-containing protein [Sphingobium sp. TB-6]NML87591.1 hypothetical protein [Sphingobium sp. TB-6]
MSYIDKLAAQHILTLHDREADGEAIRSALDWIEHDADHLVAFNRADRFMRVCGGIGRQELARLKLAPMRPELHKLGIGWRMAAIAASMLLLVIADARFLSMEHAEIASEAHFATPSGTIRSIQLADGSNVTLAGASAVEVTFRKEARMVRLLSGEALFTVVPDKNRPFTVRTQNGTATAIGTAFNVHRGADDTTVTVLHGRVEVLALGAGFMSRATLDRAMCRYPFSKIARIGLTHVPPLPRNESWIRKKGNPQRDSYFRCDALARTTRGSQMRSAPDTGQ